MLVTGATKGAGKAIAERFQQGGATVIIAARSAPEEKPDNHFIQADVSTPEGTTKVINEILERFHGVDIIIHNVGDHRHPAADLLRLPTKSGSKISMRICFLPFVWIAAFCHL